MPRINETQALDRPSQSEKQAPSRLSQAQSQAKDQAEQAKLSLKKGQQQRLEQLTQSLEKAEKRRDEVLDALSDRMVVLQDEGLFMNDLLRRTQQKLKSAKPEQSEQSEALGTAIDALVEVFDAVGDWEIPAIAPSTPLGCLPM